MALSDDLRERVVGAVVEGGMSRNAAAKRFGVSIASAVRWVARFKAKGEISPAPTGGDRRSGRIEAHRDYLLGLIRRRPDMTLLEIQERLIANCGERFSSSGLWRFFDRHDITLKKSPRMPRSSNARTLRVSAATGSPGNSISIRPASCSSTRPGLRRIWRANADAVDAAEGYAPPFRTAITRRLRSSPACAFAASWRKRPSTGRSTRPRSRNGWKNVLCPPSRKATSSSWTICRATRDPGSSNS